MSSGARLLRTVAVALNGEPYRTSVESNDDNFYEHFVRNSS